MIRALLAIAILLVLVVWLTPVDVCGQAHSDTTQYCVSDVLPQPEEDGEG